MSDIAALAKIRVTWIFGDKVSMCEQKAHHPEMKLEIVEEP